MFQQFFKFMVFEKSTWHVSQVNAKQTLKTLRKPLELDDQLSSADASAVMRQQGKVRPTGLNTAEWRESRSITNKNEIVISSEVFSKSRKCQFLEKGKKNPFHALNIFSKFEVSTSVFEFLLSE